MLKLPKFYMKIFARNLKTHDLIEVKMYLFSCDDFNQADRTISDREQVRWHNI